MWYLIALYGCKPPYRRPYLVVYVIPNRITRINTWWRYMGHVAGYLAFELDLSAFWGGLRAQSLCIAANSAHACMYVCMYVCMTRMHMCMWSLLTHRSLCIAVHSADACMYVCKYVCTYACMHMYAPAHADRMTREMQHFPNNHLCLHAYVKIYVSIYV